MHLFCSTYVSPFTVCWEYFKKRFIYSLVDKTFYYIYKWDNSPSIVWLYSYATWFITISQQQAHKYVWTQNKTKTLKLVRVCMCSHVVLRSCLRYLSFERELSLCSYNLRYSLWMDLSWKMRLVILAPVIHSKRSATKWRALLSSFT